MMYFLITIKIPPIIKGSNDKYNFEIILKSSIKSKFSNKGMLIPKSVQVASICWLPRALMIVFYNIVTQYELALPCRAYPF